MDVINAVQAMIHERSLWEMRRVGLVPTMGYLHEGHLSLVRRARAENDVVVVSIFVNPTQFGPHEDLERYPRDIPRDLQLLEAAGVDVVFAPAIAEMYPANFITYVTPEGLLTEVAEGAERPGHFRGVATIVLKLFEIVHPHHTYFGQKDAQQAAVIAHLIEDFHLPITLYVMPIIRDTDGLALSSRNAYLSTTDRKAALILYRALQVGQQVFAASMGGDPKVVTEAMHEMLTGEPRVRLSYADVRHPYTFAPLEILQAPALLAIAAHVGPTRLIDNVLLRADGSWDMGIIVAHEQH
jgi:pantoate--beta-alanine ligase